MDNPFSSGQCTHYAWKRFKQLTGIELEFPKGQGDAGRWLDTCQNPTSEVGRIYSSTRLRDDSVAVFPNHVCIVEEVIDKVDPETNEETPMVTFSGANDSNYIDGEKVYMKQEKFVNKYGGLKGILYAK